MLQRELVGFFALVFMMLGFEAFDVRPFPHNEANVRDVRVYRVEHISLLWNLNLWNRRQKNKNTEPFNLVN